MAGRVELLLPLYNAEDPAAMKDVFSALSFDRTEILKEEPNYLKVLLNAVDKFATNNAAKEFIENATHEIYFLLLDPRAKEMIDAGVLTTLKTVLDHWSTNDGDKIMISALEAVRRIATSDIDGAILKMIDIKLYDTVANMYQKFKPLKIDEPEGELIAAIRYALESFARGHNPLYPEVGKLYNESNLKEGRIRDNTYHNLDEQYLWEPYASKYKELASDYEAKYVVTFRKISGRALAAKDSNGFSDPFVEVGPAPGFQEKFKKSFKTSVKSKNLNPEWTLTEKDKVEVSQYPKVLVQVYDNDLVGSDFMGSMQFDPRLLYVLQTVSGLPEISFTSSLAEFETTNMVLKKDTKIKYDQNISGTLTVTVSVTKK